MAFSREFIRKAAKESGVEIPKELEDALVNEHISARDAYAEAQVKASEKPEVKDSEEYKKLQKEFDDYKTAQTQKESRASKEAAYKELLKEAGISEKRIAAVLRVSDVDGVELDDKGAIKGADELKKTIKSEWADFIVSTGKRGADTSNPPGNNGGGSTKTKEEIMNIKDAAQRQKAILENPALFGITLKGD